VVRTAATPGKGSVVRRMFADIEADVFLLVDSDDTYYASVASELSKLLLGKSLDMVNGVRISEVQQAYRRGHRLGNRVLTGMVATFFGNRLTDFLSGYRAFSRRFLEKFPALTSGLEIETELSVHALQLRMPLGEIPIEYRERPKGSASKLSTYKDGIRILRTIVYLIKEEKPFAFFSVVARLPTALLAASLAIFGLLSFTCGLILDTASRGRAESKRLAYLSVPVRFTSVRSIDSLGTER
jgi:hypothetical protein